MSILYITHHEFNNDDVQKRCSHNKCIYFLSINKNIRPDYPDNITAVELSKTSQEDLKIGSNFLMSHNIMMTIKHLLKKTTINKIVFNCRYIDIYFSVQYILYSGAVNNYIEMVIGKCEFSELLGDCYKFPNYWIKDIEHECITLLKIEPTKKKISQCPLLSIIIPYYNLGDYIEESIDSIKNNSYSNYEIIIVNDGSDEERSIELLEKFRGQAKLLIIEQENQGLSVARNVGVQAAQGKYITFLDPDDFIDKEYYMRTITVLEEHVDIDIAYSWVRFFEGKNEIWPTFNLRFPYLLLSNMSAAFYVIRKEKFLEFGMNRREMQKGMEDYDSLINMYKNGCKGVAIPEALVNYRYRFNSMSKGFNPELTVAIYNQVVENHKDIYDKYGIELIKLMNANGPGYLWNNPTLEYPSVILNANEDINDVKYMLMGLLNTQLGKLGVKILKWYKTKTRNR